MQGSPRFGELTWEEVRDLQGTSPVALLPIGAIEAHGPHLPLSTDGIIARAMADRGAVQLNQSRTQALVLPSLHYTAAPFAGSFPGTLSVRPETVTSMIVEIGLALLASGIQTLGIANAHLDPTHLGSIHSAVERLQAAGLATAFPDLARRPWGARLTAEFKSGACHAGSFESSVVMAARPELVREEVRLRLPPNPSSLSRAISEGKKTFHEADGPMAYFGDPAAATESEGFETIEVLGAILHDAVLEALGAERPDDGDAPSS